jgi:hypothetical protein
VVEVVDEATVVDEDAAVVDVCASALAERPNRETVTTPAAAKKRFVFFIVTPRCLRQRRISKLLYLLLDVWELLANRQKQAGKNSYFT